LGRGHNLNIFVEIFKKRIESAKKKERGVEPPVALSLLVGTQGSLARSCAFLGQLLYTPTSPLFSKGTVASRRAQARLTIYPHTKKLERLYIYLHNSLFMAIRILFFCAVMINFEKSEEM